MENRLLAAASYENRKFYMAPEFSGMPDQIKDEVKIICVLGAERLACDFIMEFSPEGDIVFKIIQPEGVIDFDDIGAELEIKRVQREKKELLKSLKLWYLIYFTDEGEEIKKEMGL
ncbi:MAG: hypothetical protein IJM06_03255 [Firmicutes bacterium]|nr:hypothetical protein [Bacillota bacterium]